MKAFAGKVAVITGAGSGFGREFARTGAALGMKLALADVQADALAATVAELQGLGAQVFGEQVDATGKLTVPEGVVVEVVVPLAVPVVVDHTTAASLIASKPWPELLPIGGCHTGEPVNGVPPVPATQAALVKAPVQDVPPEPAV